MSDSYCISHSRRLRIAIGYIVQFEDYKREWVKWGWRLTLAGAERLSQRWHDEAWTAYARGRADDRR